MKSTLFAVCAGAAIAATAVAGSGLDLSWYTIDSGGGELTAGTLRLNGTIGQPDAGVLSNGSLVLEGGFWAGGVTPSTCLGDVTGDQQVNFDDLNLLLDRWGEMTSVGDVDGNGSVNFDDLNILLDNWGETCN